MGGKGYSLRAFQDTRASKANIRGVRKGTPMTRENKEENKREEPRKKAGYSRESLYRIK